MPKISLSWAAIYKPVPNIILSSADLNPNFLSIEIMSDEHDGAGDDLEDDVDNTTLCNSCNKEEELKAANIKILEMEKAQAEQAKVLAQQAKELEYYKNIVFNQFPNLVLPTNPPARDDN
ncbi:predicted protein [Arabidopsis lyrata subsp. lyrata]|uniref:Predicted protein n=1 Tax=Arabidopsis lyrata subsp. lyrata TaxID=81972 RepID=D7LSS3_ARALL|nr:predicted protein [Arabidopsis lyrata subsp. lyrata]